MPCAYTLAMRIHFLCSSMCQYATKSPLALIPLQPYGEMTSDLLTGYRNPREVRPGHYEAYLTVTFGRDVPVMVVRDT